MEGPSCNWDICWAVFCGGHDVVYGAVKDGGNGVWVLLFAPSHIS